MPGRSSGQQPADGRKDSPFSWAWHCLVTPLAWQSPSTPSPGSQASDAVLEDVSASMTQVPL